MWRSRQQPRSVHAGVHRGPGGASPLAERPASSGGLQYVYVTNFESNDVSAYTIGGSSGALTFLRTSGGTGTGPQIVAIDPTGKFAYAPNCYSDNVFQLCH